MHWHPNGQKGAQGTYVDGKPEGVWTIWYPDGKKEASGTYKAGKRHGAWTMWHKDGTVDKRLTGTYENGRLIQESRSK